MTTHQMAIDTYQAYYHANF